MSQSQLANMLNVDQRTVSAWEHGICEPSFTMLAKLCEIFDEDFNNHISYKCCYRKTISIHNHHFLKKSLDKKCWPSQLCMVVPFCKWCSKTLLQN